MDGLDFRVRSRQEAHGPGERLHSEGQAIALLLTANDIAGEFSVTATVGNLSTTFNLTNAAGVPAAIAVNDGGDQDAAVGSAYGTVLQAIVLDTFLNPVPGVLVSFSAPHVGATGAFNGEPDVLTNALGVATAPTFTANHEAGSFTVTATIAGLADDVGPADFDLTNTACRRR
jgi:Bacterial Ig-like domain (group 1)